MKKVSLAKSRVTGGHYAFQTDRSRRPFTNNMTECMAVRLLPTDVVADVGAYVGEYSIYASRQGVEKVLSYEPTPETFKLLEMNQRRNMVLLNMAVVGSDEKTVDLFLSSGIGVTNSIAKKTRKSGSITVPAIRYERAVKDATVVKVDVEGAEYGFNLVQPQLRALIVEFHPIVGVDWRRVARRRIAAIEASGFKPIRKPEFKHGWDVSGCWVRR